MKIPVKITLTEEAKELYPNGKPEYATEGSSGFDIRAVGFDFKNLDRETLTIEDRSEYFIFTNKDFRLSGTIEEGQMRKILTFNEVICGLQLELKPQGRILIKTGLKIQLQKGYELQIRPRSGLALKHGISITNSPATIDSDYTGEICVILENRGHDPFEINIGDRIAQGVIAPVFQADFEVVETLEETERGQGGFGSTGTN